MITHRRLCWVLLAAALGNSACLSRAIREGTGAVTGASGRYVTLQQPGNLSHYRGLTVEPVGADPGVAPGGHVPLMIRTAYRRVGSELGLDLDGTPGLVIHGHIIHYESGGQIDQAIGPLQEMVVRTRLRDAQDGRLLGEANLVGRAQSLTAGGADKLAGGVGKALERWLRDSGLVPPNGG